MLSLLKIVHAGERGSWLPYYNGSSIRAQRDLPAKCGPPFFLKGFALANYPLETWNAGGTKTQFACMSGKLTQGGGGYGAPSQFFFLIRNTKKKKKKKKTIAARREKQRRSPYVKVPCNHRDLRRCLPETGGASPKILLLPSREWISRKNILVIGRW